MVKGQFDMAQTEFNAVLKQDAEFIPAQLALAALYVARQQWTEAIGLYQAVLQKADIKGVRHGIAYCMAMIKSDIARTAFRRILALVCFP